MTAASRQPSPIERLPEEMLLNILDYNFDIGRLPLLVATDPSCGLPQLQLQHKLQMSLCRVSKTFHRSISRLLRQSGLLRVTCWLDPHLDFYYLSPTICLSERADMFQTTCPRITIDLAHGLPQALPVRSVISVAMLPTVLQIARLHHTAGLTVLPQINKILEPHGKMTINISYDPLAGFPFLSRVKMAISNTLPSSKKVRETANAAHFDLITWKEHETLPSPSWNIAYEIGRRYSLSKDTTERLLGLQILRYLLATMLVVINPWNKDKIAYADFTVDVKMMSLISAVLIDALVVEPKMLQIFYEDATPEVVHDFHKEVCPCRYLPHGIQSGARYGYQEGHETWLFVQSATYFLHNILPCEKPQRVFWLEDFRKRCENITLDTPEVKERCKIYVGALERYHDGGKNLCCLSSDGPIVSYSPVEM